MKKHTPLLLSVLLAAVPLGTAQADSIVDKITGDLFHWQTNEIHFQYGWNYEQAFVPGDPDEDGYVITLQHADGWKYGDNFFFIDFSDLDDSGTDLYMEAYFNFSAEKIFGTEIEAGPLTDVGAIFGFNYAREAEVYKYLPGIRLAWDAPGFAFLNTDIMAYIDDSEGVSGGGAPSEDDSFLIDVNWARPFSIGNQDFSIEGHIEYAHERDNEFGSDVESHILAQPQFRYDLGKQLFNAPQKFFVGLEYQYWHNKLGDDGTHEHNAQALAVLRF